MKKFQDIQGLSNKIWGNCIHRPTRIETQIFDKELEQINIKEFIIYNFLNHQRTSLRELLLSIFKFWQNLSLNEWKQITDKLRGNNLAEYYFAIISNQYLGIDPKFKSTKNLETFHFTPTDNKRQIGKPSLFIDNMQGDLRYMQEIELKESFGLTIEDFVSIKNRLNFEMDNEPKAKNIWQGLWNK